jgi:hypothetical protein
MHTCARSSVLLYIRIYTYIYTYIHAHKSHNTARARVSAVACAVGGRQYYKIKIFNVATGSLAMTLPGHKEIVYDMQVRDRFLYGIEALYACIFPLGYC